MVIKLDMFNAFDRVHHDFVLNFKFGFLEELSHGLRDVVVIRGFPLDVGMVLGHFGLH